MNKVIKFFKNPIVIIFSVLAGVFLGIYCKEIIQKFAFFGYLMLFIVLFLAFPMLIVQIVTGVAGLFSETHVGKKLRKSILTIFIFIIVSSSVGTAIGVVNVVFSPLENSEQEKYNKIVSLSSDFDTLEITLNTKSELEIVPEFNLKSLLQHNVIENSFFYKSIQKFIIVAVILSCLAGCIAGIMNAGKKNDKETAIERFLGALRKLYSGLLCLIPFSTIIITGNAFSLLRLNDIKPLKCFLSSTIEVMFLLVFLSVLSICIKTKQKNPFKVFYTAFKNSVFCLGVSNTIAFLPAECSAMENKKSISFFRFIHTVCGFLCNFANIAFTAIVICFAMKIYGESFTAQNILLIAAASIISGFFSAGMPCGGVFISIVAIFPIMKLPSEAVVSICLAVECLSMPLRAFVQIVVLRAFAVYAGLLEVPLENKQEYSKEKISETANNIIMNDNNFVLLLNAESFPKDNEVYKDCKGEIKRIIQKNGGQELLDENNRLTAFWNRTELNSADLACEASLEIKSLLSKKKDGLLCSGGIGITSCIEDGERKRIKHISPNNIESVEIISFLTSKYGIAIIVSEDIYSLAKEKYEFRILDRDVETGGKTISAIYELLAKKDMLGSGMKKLYNYYETGLAYYFTKKYDKTIKYMDFILKYINDRPSKIMKERALKKKE